MNNILIAMLLGYLTDILGIGIGVLCTFFLFLIKKNFLSKGEVSLKRNVLFSLVFEFSSGLMMAVVTFRLIPDALSNCGTPLTLGGIFAGLWFVHFIQKLADIKIHGLKTSLILLINLWLHNIPEGFILGNFVCNNMAEAFLFFGAIVIHNIPQGFLIALPSTGEKIKNHTLLYMIFLSGIPTAAGSFLGAFLNKGMPLFTGFMLSFAAGAMLYTLIFELSYEARKLYGRKIIEVAYITGLLLGIIIV